MSDLLPCPFCGGEARYYHRPDTTGWSNTDWVSCSGDCGASTCMHETKEEAIAAWNTRSDEVQAAVAAALREAAQVARASFDGELGYDEILDLITPDAQAALDRYVKGRSDDAVEKMLYHLYLADQYTNLVEKGQGDA